MSSNATCVSATAGRSASRVPAIAGKAGFGAALIGIYILLMNQTGTFIMPLAIMMSIPLMIIGVMPGFLLLNHIGSHTVARQRLRLNIAREVRTAAVELEAAQSRVESLQEAVREAADVLRNEQAKYDAGKTVINFVLEAEANLLANQSLLCQAQRSVAVATLSLDLSLGKIRPDTIPGK